MEPRLDLPIHTDRLMLREFLIGDADAVLVYASDPDVMRYMFYGPWDRAETHAYIGRMLHSQHLDPRPLWELAIVRSATGQLIGACDLTMEDSRMADLGYILGRAAWGQGFATEAACALVQVGFARLHLARIVATCDVDNRASARVLEKSGLRREAVLERHRQAKGRWWTSYLYGLDRSDWQACPTGC